MSPIEMINRYSADAVRYWASSTGLGKDSIISEEKIQNGARLVNKLWNIARFLAQFINDYKLPKTNAIGYSDVPHMLTPADRWILSRLQQIIIRATSYLENYEYAHPKNEIESYFWNDFTDNYLEMCKQRLYNNISPSHDAAKFTLYSVVLNLIKLLAPYLPYVTDAIYQLLFRRAEGFKSIHLAPWPSPSEDLIDSSADELGLLLVEIATVVRRYKSQHNLPLGTEISVLKLSTNKSGYQQSLLEAKEDLLSITRARDLEITSSIPPSDNIVETTPNLIIAIEPTSM